MSLWVLLQIIVNLCFIAGFVLFWMKSRREPSEDPRLSRGLQMVSSKIAVLEDLSKQTDIQCQQISALIEQKAKQLLEQIEKSDEQIAKIEFAQKKSLEVAQIFQDKIPHEEIRHREETMKYIQVARLAHEGMTAEEIQEKVGLSRGEIEMIAKLDMESFLVQESQVSTWRGEDLRTQGGEESPAQSNSGTGDAKLRELSEKFKKIPQMQEQAAQKKIVVRHKGIQPYDFPRV